MSLFVIFMTVLIALILLSPIVMIILEELERAGKVKF